MFNGAGSLRKANDNFKYKGKVLSIKLSGNFVNGKMSGEGERVYDGIGDCFYTTRWHNSILPNKGWLKRGGS